MNNEPDVASEKEEEQPSHKQDISERNVTGSKDT